MVKYTQTKQGQNISSLIVPTAPKAKDTRVVADKVKPPSKWDNQLLTTALNVGIKAYGDYLGDQETKARSAVSNMYLDRLKEDTVEDMTANIEPSVKDVTEPVNRLQSWGTSYSKAIESLDSFNLSKQDKDKLISDVNNKYTDKILSLQEETFKATKEKAITKINSTHQKIVTSDIIAGTLDAKKLLTDTTYSKSISKWTKDFNSSNKYLNNMVQASLSYISDDLSKLTKLKDTYKSYIDDEIAKDNGKLTEEDLKTYDVIDRTLKAKIQTDKRNDRQIKQAITQRISDIKKTKNTQVIVAFPGFKGTSDFSLAGVNKDEFKKYSDLPEYRKLLTEGGYSPDVIDYEIDAMKDSLYYKKVTDETSTILGKGVVNLDTVADPKLKSILKYDLIQEVQWGLQNNLNYVNTLSYDNRSEVIKQLKPVFRNDLHQIIKNKDIGKFKEDILTYKNKLRALSNVSYKILDDKDKIVLDFADVATTTEELDTLKEFMSAESSSIPSVYLSSKEFKEATDGLSINQAAEFGKVFDQIVFLNKGLSREEAIDKTIKHFEHLVTDNIRMSKEADNVFTDHASLFNAINIKLKYKGQSIPKDSVVDIENGMVKVRRYHKDGSSDVIFRDTLEHTNKIYKKVLLDKEIHKHNNTVKELNSKKKLVELYDNLFGTNYSGKGWKGKSDPNKARNKHSGR